MQQIQRYDVVLCRVDMGKSGVSWAEKRREDHRVVWFHAMEQHCSNCCENVDEVQRRQEGVALCL